MPLGPIEVVVIGFPGGEVGDATLAELERLVEAETISVVDALYIRKDENGDVIFAEVDEPGANEDVARLATLLQQLESLISDEDVDEFAAALEPGDSAAILVFEHTWAKPFRDSVVASGGVLVANFRVPGLAVDDLLRELESVE